MPENLYVGRRKNHIHYSLAEVLLGSTAGIVVWPVSQVFELRLPKLSQFTFQRGRPSSSYFWPWS